MADEEQTVVETQPAAAPPSEPVAEKPRDERGRFAPQEETPPVTQPEESAPEAAPDDEPAKSPAAEDAPVADEKLVARARALLIPDDTIADLAQHNGALQAFVDNTLRYHERLGAAARQRPNQVPPAPPPSALPPTPAQSTPPKAPQQPATPLEERLAMLERREAERVAAIEEQNKAWIRQQADDAFNAAPEALKAILGSGDTQAMERNPAASGYFAARMEVWESVVNLANGMAVAGQQPPPIPALVEAVLNMKYSKELQGAQVKQVADKLNERTAKMTLPPGQRRGEPAATQEDRDKRHRAEVGKILRKRGLVR